MTDDTHDSRRRGRGRTEQPAEQVAELPAEQQPAEQPAAHRLTEGERADLELHGVTRAADGSGLLYADDHGIEPSTEQARARLAAARAEQQAAPPATEPGS